MYPTKNDLNETTRIKICELLNARLADLIDLKYQAKQAHWNVKGPSFIALHELFDKVQADVEIYVDDTAERVVQLGGTAEGTIVVAAKRSSLTEYPLNIAKGDAHVEALSSAIAKAGKGIRAAIGHSDELGDADTADLFTGISRGLDKYLWFVEAYLEAKK